MELKYSKIVGEERTGRYTFINLECPCGKLYQRRKDRLRIHAICISCTRSKGASKYGMYKTPEYRAWGKMRERCNQVRCKAYHNYGKRGISICKRWDTFENFFADLGPRPSSKHSLDRIDNNGDYCPENCRWATMHEQTNNQRKTVFLTYKGKTKPLTQWARIYNIEPWVLHGRIRTNWPIAKALTFPVRPRKPNKKVA